MIKQKPLVSVIIPTFNSGPILSSVLNSIKKQNYPAKKIEVLVIDGGSTDETLLIANKYKAKILVNKKQHQVYAKHMGHMVSKGRYIVHLDSDEVLENKNSILNKILLFEKYSNVKAVVPSGHKTPVGVSGSNYIINDFGDPFSFYMYGFSFNYRFFINQLKSKFKIVSEDRDAVVIDFQKSKNLPGIEMSASGMMLDREYLNNRFSKIKSSPHLISQVFYFLVEQGDLVGFTKNDPILHYSASSWNKYLKKLKSRVLNNVFKTEMGKSAFSGRESYYSLGFTIKKYLFIPYSLSIILPLLTGIWLSVTRKTFVFLTYPYLCLFILYLTMYYMAEKALGIMPKNKGYGF